LIEDYGSSGDKRVDRAQRAILSQPSELNQLLPVARASAQYPPNPLDVGRNGS
jgi:hypothetical protein